MYKQYKVTILNTLITERDIIVQSNDKLSLKEIEKYAFLDNEVYKIMEKDNNPVEECPESQIHYRARYEKEIYKTKGIKVKDNLPTKTIKSESNQTICEVIAGKNDLQTSQERLEFYKKINI